MSSEDSNLLNPAGAVVTVSDEAPAPEYQSLELLSKYSDASGVKKYVFVFPPRFEFIFKPFDDAIIRFVQAPLHTGWAKVARAFAVVFTFLTAIEIGICLPFALHILGYDAIASRACVLMLVTSLFSQIPKRFIWRARPYMTEPPRAFATGGDKTSSFPSRAVTCAVVYGFLLAEAVTNNGYHEQTWVAIFGFAICFALAAAFSRILLGVHYPSDCLCGAIMGTIICVVATLLYNAEFQACVSCTFDKCYGLPGQQLDSSNLSKISAGILVVASCVSVFLMIISIVPPIRFWNKCSHVYGVLLSCLTFRLTFICKPLYETSMALPPPSRSNLSLVVALICVAVTSVVGMVSGKKKKMSNLGQVIVFIFIYASVLFVMAWWRLSGH